MTGAGPEASTQAEAGRSLAIYGGSFDPPHVAHVLVATWAKSVAGVDGVLVVPTFAHAFGKRSAPFEDRAALCEAAFGDLPFVEVSRVEATLGSPSRSWRTIAALGERYPGARFRFVVGADVLAETDRWERWDEVARAAPPLVGGRVGHAPPPGPCPVVLPDVSSTELRRRLAQGEATEGWLPAAGAAEIHARGLARFVRGFDRAVVEAEQTQLGGVRDGHRSPAAVWMAGWSVSSEPRRLWSSMTRMPSTRSGARVRRRPESNITSASWPGVRYSIEPVRR